MEREPVVVGFFLQSGAIFSASGIFIKIYFKHKAHANKMGDFQCI